MRYHTLALVHKTVCLGEPEELARGFVRVGSIRERTTRQDANIVVPSSRTGMGQSRFSSRGASLYNELPEELSVLPARFFVVPLKSI